MRDPHCSRAEESFRADRDKRFSANPPAEPYCSYYRRSFLIEFEELFADRHLAQSTDFSDLVVFDLFYSLIMKRIARLKRQEPSISLEFFRMKFVCL